MSRETVRNQVCTPYEIQSDSATHHTTLGLTQRERIENTPQNELGNDCENLLLPDDPR